LPKFCTARSFASDSAQTKGPVSYISLGLTAATGAGLLYWYQHEKSKKLQALSGNSGVVVGQAAIGGPFNLIDHRGKPFTDANLRGTFSLLYFGFTHCPDICPEELEKVVEAVELVAKRPSMPKGAIVPVFITLDPERDGPAQIAAYVSEFHPCMVGLTGTPEAVREAAKAYRVYYTRAALSEVSGSDGPDADDDYLIDHSIITYLLDPEGNFVAFYGKNYNAEDMASSVAGHIDSWRRTHPDWKCSTP